MVASSLLIVFLLAVFKLPFDRKSLLLFLVDRRLQANPLLL